MKVYVTHEFARFAAKEGIDDLALCAAVARAENGLIDADLAGPIIKQRIARAGTGASRGYRAILVYQAGRLAPFVHGFPKNSKANLTATERTAYAEFGKVVAAMPVASFDAAVAKRKWRKVECEQFPEDIP